MVASAKRPEVATSPRAHLHHAAAMGRSAHHLVGDAERVHDIERGERDVRGLEHVAAGVEYEIRRGVSDERAVVGLLAEPREHLVAELHLGNVLHLARDLAETFDAAAGAAPAARRACCAIFTRAIVQHEARIDAVVAGLDAFAGEHAGVGPLARRVRAVAGLQNVDDAG